MSLPVNTASLCLELSVHLLTLVVTSIELLPLRFNVKGIELNSAQTIKHSLTMDLVNAVFESCLSGGTLHTLQQSEAVGRAEPVTGIRMTALYSTQTTGEISHLLTHLLTRSLIRLLTHSLAHSFTRSLVHSFALTFDH